MDETDKTDIEQRIRERAYALWEAEGRPEGRSEEYWHRASEELRRPAPSGPPNRPGAVTEALENMLPAANIPDHTGSI